MLEQTGHFREDGQLCSDAPPKGFSVAGDRMIAKLLENVGAKTDEDLNDRFGISYNTWRKLMAGKPVRLALLSRLERRLGLDDA